MERKNSFKVNQNDDQFVRFLFYGLVLITLYFNTKANDPFNTYKLILAMILAGLLSGQVILLIRNNLTENKELDFYILPVVTFFLLAQLLALSKTDVFLVGLIGESQRRNGFLSYLALSIIFVFTALKINFNVISRFLEIIILTGLVLVVYGTMQITGRDFVKWVNPHNAMVGTLGNPNFASAMLAIIILLSIFSLFHGAINRLYKVLCVPVIVLGLNAIYESNSIQGLLVIGIGLLLYASFTTFFGQNKYRRIIPIASIIIIMVSILGILQKGPLAYYLYKPSVSVRGYYWNAAINMFKSSPVFGVGLDRYGASFKEFRSSEYPLRYGYEITSSNAHNTYLHFFATGGIFVGASYCILMILIFVCGLKSLRNSQGNHRKIVAALISTWVAFQAQSFISIDNVGISIWGWILGGSIIGLYRSGNGRNTMNSIQRKNSINLFPVTISVMVLIPMILTAVLLHRQEADLFVAKSALLQSPINRELAVANAQKVLDNNLADPFYKFEAALVFYDLGNTVPAELKIRELSTQDARNLFYLDWLAISNVKKGDLNNALKYALQIYKYDPWNAKNLLLVGELYKSLGNRQDMQTIRLKINEIAPNTEISELANQRLV